MATLSLTVASCDFCSSDRRFASAFLQIPLALIIVVAMKRTPLVLAVSFPLLGRIRNFHPLVTCAARHTKKEHSTKYLIYEMFFFIFNSNPQSYRSHLSQHLCFCDHLTSFVYNLVLPASLLSH